MFAKLAWILIAFVVISVGRSIVFWVCMNVLRLEYETGDNVAALYVVVAVIVVIFVWVRHRLG